MTISRAEERLLDLTRARASFYGFVNLHFMELPDERFAASLREAEFISALESLAQSHDVHREIARGVSLMGSYLTATGNCPPRELSQQLGVDRTRLYRGVSPTYGPVPPYEALWIGKNRGSDVLPEMAGIYQSSGFALQEGIQERLDYIGVQLSYMEQLATREIETREAGRKEEVRAVLTCEKAFLEDHLGKWIPSFVKSALERAQTDFYRGHLYMLQGFIEQEREVMDKLRDPSWIPGQD